MPTPPLEEPTTKITIHIFSADVEAARRRWPEGWHGEIRRIVKEAMRKPAHGK